MIRVSFLIAALIGAGSWAEAYTPGACVADAEKFCPGVDDKGVIPCLQTHSADLSMDCKVNLAEAREGVRDMKDACAQDMQKYCKDVPMVKGQMRRCLKANEAKLTKECKDSVMAFKQKYKGVLASTPTPNSANP